MLHSRWDDPAEHPGEQPAVDSREPLRPRLRWRPVAHHRQHHPVPVTSKRSLMDYAASFPNNSSSCTRFWYLLAMELSGCGPARLWLLLVVVVVVSTGSWTVVLIPKAVTAVVTEVVEVMVLLEVVLDLMWEKWC